MEITQEPSRKLKVQVTKGHDKRQIDKFVRDA